MPAYEPLPRTESDGDTDEGASVASSIEAPPFALAHNDDLPLNEGSDTLNSQHSGTIFVNTTPELGTSHAMSSVTTEGQRSMLQSSTMSNRHTATSSSQHTHGDGVETYVFEAADSMLGSSQPTTSMLGTSDLPGSGTLWTHDSSTTAHDGSGSLDFSQLMRQADDQHDHSTIIVQSRMPTLSEKEEVLLDSGQTPTSTESNVTPRTTNESGHGTWLQSLLHGSSPSQQQHHIHAVPMMSLSPSYLDAGMAGAGRDIQATRLGENTFEVTMQIDPPSTVRDVMDVVGNPDLLRLWCDPIRALVVTKSSEGAQSATNRGGGGEQSREYEGEWIEATTSTLVSPTKHSSCLYNLGHLIYTSLGFPSYGKITLFVERLRGQIGLTIGPFSGGIVASHTIQVQDDGPVVSVVDKVRLSRDEESCLCCCGLCEPIKRCFMPRMAAHMEQVLSSMMRLRVLVEHGETGAYAANPGVGYNEEEGISSIPLLS